MTTAFEDRLAEIERSQSRDLLQPIDWARFWLTEEPAQDWLVEPLIPAGRQVAVFSEAKSGKSLLALEMAAALATGGPVLGQPPCAPRSVLYIDQEMTESDLRERLTDMGYGPGDDLTRLVYFQLCTLAPLDRPSGAEAMAKLIDVHQPELVVLDTMARVVDGEENSSDTYRNFYQFTGLLLKARGVSLLRLDHSGKDGARGQRGSSSKADDVDVVWRLTADGATVRLTCTHKRVAWVPNEVTLTRHEEPILRHALNTANYLAGTADVAALLDELEVPLDATLNTASAALKAARQGRRRSLVGDALKFRKSRP